MKPLLQVNHVSKTFRLAGPLGQPARRLKAVQDVTFSLNAGETLGIVGESGCGKSTLAKLLLRLLEADGGQVLFNDIDLLSLSRNDLREQRRQMQMVFQDPYASLNPRMSVGQTISEPFLIHKLASGDALRQEVERLMETVGLPAEFYHRYPHEFSGGQRQRIGIARALAVKPQLIVADEPVSALDLSIQAQVINLLQDIQHQFNLTYVLIAHDLAVVEHISDRIAVMYLGRIVEMAPSTLLVNGPRHPYTEALLSAVPVPDPSIKRRSVPLQGEVPSPVDPPSGCAFHPRCLYAQAICRKERPELTEVAPGHLTACHFHAQVGQGQRDEPQ